MAPATRSRWTTQRKLAVASIACADVAGLVVLLEMTLTDFGGPDLPWVWWSAYALFLVTLLLIHGFVPRPRRLPVNVLLVTHVVLAVALVALFAEQGWTAILFVVTAATISFFWRPRTVLLVATLQTALIGSMIAAAGWPLADVLMGILAYGNFQAFGALVVFAARGEAAARADLAIANTELRSTAALLEMTTREAERLRIARDLHDLAGHHLTALSLELEVLSHLVEDGPGREHQQRASSIAKELLQSVRTAVTEMREASPALEPTLLSLADSVTALEISVHIRESDRIPVEYAAIVVHCVQEAITNCLRHAGARHLDVTVEADTRGVRVAIRDDGSGVAEIKPGNGLLGMIERFETEGGTLRVSSGVNVGFSIHGSLPGTDRVSSRSTIDIGGGTG